MAITADGTRCTEPANPAAQALISGGKIASFIAAKVSVRHDIAVNQPRDAITEVGAAYVAEERSGPFNFNPAISLPPSGTCTAYWAKADFPSTPDTIPGVLPPTGRMLDPGVPQLTGTRGVKPFVFIPTLPGVFGAFLNASIAGISPATQTYLEPGSYMLSSSGGRDIGAFNANVDVPQPLVWTNRDQVTTINRAQGFTVNWSGGGANNPVFIVGGGADMPSNSASIFVCSAPGNASSFTVPPAVLANIPASRERLTQTRAAVYVGRWPLSDAVRFQASGLDWGVLLHALVAGKTVVWQ
jgi:hypothetical protein